MPDRKKVLKLLRERVVGENAAHNPVVYLANQAANSPEVTTWGRVIKPSSNFPTNDPVSVAFIDHMPGANYEHRVQYAFVNEQQEIVETIEATTPPDNLDTGFTRVDLDVHR